MPDANETFFLQTAIREGDGVQVHPEVRRHLPHGRSQRPFRQLSPRNQRLYLIDELLIKRPRVSFINRYEHIVC
jgi:hypothetical protein